MRIISGNFRGKKLFFPNNKSTRPLKDIVKESIFNLLLHSKKLNFNIENSMVLDLFSGSGSFGIECISRGAQKVIFLEQHPDALKSLEKNINLLKEIKNYSIIKDDFFDFFSSDKDLDFKFNLIFIDPPYKEKKINEIIEKILEKKILLENGIIIIHRHKNDDIALTSKINIFEKRIYGLSKILFGN